MSYNLKVINQLDREALVKIILETFTNRGHPMYTNDSFNRAKQFNITTKQYNQFIDDFYKNQSDSNKEAYRIFATTSLMMGSRMQYNYIAKIISPIDLLKATYIFAKYTTRQAISRSQ